MPNTDVLGSTNGDSRFYKQLVDNSATINEGDKLFDVYAKTFNADGTMDDFEMLGEILQGDSEWTESLWGDERLYFAHGFQNYDWRDFEFRLFDDDMENSQRKRNFDEVFNEEARFDFEDKYSFNAEFEPLPASESDIIDGMVTTGCPFAYLIDQINQFTL